MTIQSYIDEESKLQKKLKPAMDYLHTNYTDSSLSVLTLCDMAHVSDTWFRKLFMKCYGMKPTTYINTLRIDYAKELLANGYYKIEAVARLSGFENPKYFSTLFKQYTGLSPLQYKNERGL